MHRYIVTCAVILVCYLALCVSADDSIQQNLSPATLGIQEDANDNIDDTTHIRTKRTLFLKKKLIGAGLLGFGLGIAKGYKLGYHSAPEVHRIYVPPPPPPVKYVEYVEKPIFVQRIIEKPVFKSSSVEYEPSPPYGAW